jgi:hypothetical protein
LSDNNIIAEITCKEGYHLEETKNVTYTKEPNFFRIGDGTKDKKGLTAMDFISELLKMDASERFVIELIKEQLKFDPFEQRTNLVAKIKVSALGKAKANTFSIGYKKLKAKGLVRRLKMAHYMINPDALVPSKNYAKVKAKLWDPAK